MASDTLMATSTPQSPTIYSPSKQPLPLSAAQEAQVRDLYYKRVRNYCADEIRGQNEMSSHVADPANTRLRLCVMRAQSYHLGDVVLPDTEIGDEQLHDITFRAG